LKSADLLIIGAGIAGASSAWFAARAGRRPTLIDAGVERASSVPTALINPVRGYQGRLVKRGHEAACFTFKLIETLQAEGHLIPHGRGLWRPAPDLAVRKNWTEQLPADFPHRWHDNVPATLRLKGSWSGVLELPDSGWVEAAALISALLASSGTQIITARVTDVQPGQRSVMLADGTRIKAHELLWCGGAHGAAQLGYAATFRPGSLLMTRAPVTDCAVSHGLYAAPCGKASVMGPTTEPSASVYPDGPAPPEAIDKLLERATRMFDRPVEVHGIWRAVRLARVALPPGMASLTGLGSRGFLMAPLQASEYAHRTWGGPQGLP